MQRGQKLVHTGIREVLANVALSTPRLCRAVTDEKRRAVEPNTGISGAYCERFMSNSGLMWVDDEDDDDPLERTEFRDKK